MERAGLRVIGHRGAAALAPENTWAGFDLALALGVDAIETDVRATRDAVLVLLHDERLDRTTDGTGRVQDAGWSTLQGLEAGTWFDARYAGQRVPSLRETLERFGRRTHLVLEIKQDGVEEAALTMVRSSGLLGRVTFTSFSFPVVAWLKSACPKLRVGYLSRQVGPEVVDRVLDAGLDQFCPPADSVTRELVSDWQARGLDVRAWGVRDAELMGRAIRAGVDGMTVDFPDLLLEALGRRAKGPCLA
jgi:glycerophosphoryl diester phosphodiesterase